VIVERHPTTALSRANLAALRDLLELSYLGDFSEDERCSPADVPGTPATSRPSRCGPVIDDAGSAGP
jgi:hypothetical protein